MATTSIQASERSNRHKPFLTILAMAVFFVGASEFMLSAMLDPLAVAFDTSSAGAMGLVMPGMTFGISLGPALAGLLTELSGWCLPFLVTASGYILAFIVGSRTAPRSQSPSHRATQGHFRWVKNWAVLRPLIAKGAWNGTGVAAFLLSGEMLKQRYHLSVVEIGITVTAFGVGLGLVMQYRQVNNSGH